MKEDEIKQIVKQGYARIAKKGDSCCTAAYTCCGSSVKAEDISKEIGYGEDEFNSVPEGANLGLGCGNPIALASLKEGETVLDLGSGAGFDCFLAANKVGISGKVIGVDMTPEMVSRARTNAAKGNYKNVEFRLGEIENLPVADNSIDVAISNCVINLSPDKRKVFSEILRVLKPGGRMIIADIVLLKKLPEFIEKSIEAYVGCLSGAIMRDDYIDIIRDVGFRQIKIMDESPFPIELMTNDPTAKAILENVKISVEKARELAESVLSLKIYAIK